MVGQITNSNRPTSVGPMKDLVRRHQLVLGKFGQEMIGVGMESVARIGRPFGEAGTVPLTDIDCRILADGETVDIVEIGTNRGKASVERLLRKILAVLLP